MQFLRLLFISLFLCFSGVLSAQEFQARILDASTQKPVAYANVLFSENRGVVTNEEGFFSFRTAEKPQLIKISSMGYDMLELQPEDLRETIFLIPATVELKEVFLSDKKLSAKAIIMKALEEVPNNYDQNLSKKRIFLRESNINYVRNFDLHVDKSTIPGIDQQLMNEIANEVPKVSDSYKEVLADLYGNYESQKVRIIKAANLHNPKSSQTLDELTDRLELLFRENLKDKSYLKIRSGLFGVKVKADELEEEFIQSKEVKKEKTPAQLAAEKIEDQKNLQSNSALKLSSLMNSMFWNEDVTFNLFQKINRYKYKLEGITHINADPVYIISFGPRRGQDFKGKIYINTIDYGVHRLDYENTKPLKSFRLLGLSTSDDVYTGKMIFVKNEAGKYSISYLEQEKGESFGLKRPLTIIEKNKFVPGRNKQNELDLDIKIKMSQVGKLQLLVYEDQKISSPDFDAVKDPGTFDYQTFKFYNADFWNGHNIMEPNAAIKKFTAFEEQLR